MTPPPVRWLLLASFGIVASGVWMLVSLIAHYLETPRAISSTAGLVVFRSADGYVSFVPFTMGFEPAVIGVGVALVVAALFVAAIVWRPRV